jgi:hypothetical protein
MGILPTKKRQLPTSFKPTADTVIIAKGKNIRFEPGNQKLEAVVRNHLDEYQGGNGGRIEKALIVRRVILSILADSPDDYGFVKFDGKRYWEADELSVREKVSSMFRNQLEDMYRSSTKIKSARRRQKKTSGTFQKKVKQPSTTPALVVSEPSFKLSGDSGCVETSNQDDLNILTNLPPDQRCNKNCNEQHDEQQGGEEADLPSSSVVDHSLVTPSGISSMIQNGAHRSDFLLGRYSLALRSTTATANNKSSSLNVVSDEDSCPTWSSGGETKEDIKHIQSNSKAQISMSQQDMGALPPPSLHIRESAYYFMEELFDGESNDLLESADPFIFEEFNRA